MTDTTTQAVTALLDGVTPGPWVITYEYGDKHMKGPEGQSLMCDMTYYPWTFSEQADWEFVAAARDLVPAILAERDALAAQLASAEARARESALEALSAYGQAADAHAAQLSAEAKLAVAVDAMGAVLVSLAEYRHRSKKIAFDIAMRADRAEEAARAALAQINGDE